MGHKPGTAEAVRTGITPESGGVQPNCRSLKGRRNRSALWGGRVPIFDEGTDFVRARSFLSVFGEDIDGFAYLERHGGIYFCANGRHPPSAWRSG